MPPASVVLPMAGSWLTPRLTASSVISVTGSDLLPHVSEERSIGALHVGRGFPGVRTQFVAARAHPSYSGRPRRTRAVLRPWAEVDVFKHRSFGVNDPPRGIIPRQPVVGEARRWPHVMRFRKRGRVVQRGQFGGCGGGGPCAAGGGGDASAATGRPGVVTFGAQHLVRTDSRPFAEERWGGPSADFPASWTVGTPSAAAAVIHAFSAVRCVVSPRRGRRQQFRGCPGRRGGHRRRSPTPPAPWPGRRGRPPRARSHRGLRRCARGRGGLGVGRVAHPALR